MVKTKECFKALHWGNNVRNWLRYQNARNETRKVVSEAQFKAFEKSYKLQRFQDNEEQRIYKLDKGKQDIWIR